MATVDPEILGRILLLQSSLHAAPDEQRLGEQVCHIFKEIPGIQSIVVYNNETVIAHTQGEPDFPGEWPPPIEKVPELICSVHATQDNHLQLLSIRTSKEIYGYFVIAVTDYDQFTNYLPYIENSINLIALVFENRQQAKILQEDRDFLDAVLDNIEDGIVACNREGVLTLFNRATKEFHGLPMKAISADDWVKHYDLFHADGITPLQKDEVPLFQALEGRYIHDQEFVIAPKHGRKKTVLSSGQPLIDRQGKKLGAVVSMHDITERKDAEKALKKARSELEIKVEERTIALRQQKEFTETALNAQKDTFVVFDPLQRKPIRWNTAFVNIIGSTDEEIRSQKIPDDLFAGEDLHKIEHAIETVFEKGHATVELSVVTRDKKTIFTEYSIALLDSHEEKSTYMIAVGRDISERKEVEGELRRWAQIFKNAKWGIAVGDVEKNTLDLVNPAFAAMHGFSQAELLNKEITELFAPAYRAQLSEVVRKCLESEHYTFEADHIRKDGTIFPVYHDISTVRNDQGQALYRIASIQDITENKQAVEEKKNLEARLQQAQKMEAIGTLAGGIAHDFNNILGVILGYADMAKDDVPQDSKLGYDLDKVLEAGNRARDLVKQILAFSRQEKVERIPIQLQSLVKEALKILRSSLPATIEIKNNIDPKCGVVLADPTQVHQIVMNLCANASHSMEESGGTLRVELKNVVIGEADSQALVTLDPGEYVELTVSDTGSGIHPEILDRIFDPYFTTKAAGKGTGMGLSITHGIVADYGGEITVESEIGHGATFHVYFPIVHRDEVEETSGMDVTPPGKERVLFIDDEELLAELGQQMLERLGYEVTVRRSSLEALSTFQNDPDAFDVVITDQTMPGITGSDLARRMLQIRPDIPVILCTGYSNLIDEATAKSFGIKEFALKPLTRKTVAHLIRKVLDNS